MPRYLFRYLILAAILACACWVRGSGAWNLFRIFRDPDASPEAPFSMVSATRTIGSSSLRYNQILAIDGKPFTAEKQYEDAVFTRQPGDKIVVTLSEPNGRAVEKTVAILSQRINFHSFEQIPLAVIVDLLVPLICIFLGAFAVAIRPADRNAWLLLFLLLAFTEMASRDYGGVPAWNALWDSLVGNQMPLFMMLFGIYFPERSAFEKKRPWLKYLLIVPCAVVPLISTIIDTTWLFDVNAAQAYRGLRVRLFFFQSAFGMLAVCTYFVSIGFKSVKAESADSRRRLRILSWGSSISLTPLFLLVLASVIRQRDIMDVPWFFIVITFSFLIVFPLTLAYVIVVERAMDLRFVVRRSLQYGVARVSLWLVRALVTVLAIYLVRTATMHSDRLGSTLEFAALGVGLVLFRNTNAKRASQWVDRKFFRESYDAERVLAELAREVGSFIEIRPLLEKVATRISQTLHVPDIVILLKEGDLFIPSYSTRPGEPMNVSAQGRIAKVLRDRGEALEIYFDKPPLWLRSLSAEELHALDFMRTQVLLPLTGRGQMTGILSLGPKLSEVPYTAIDIRLLQAVASQMSLAIDNSRLVASLAAEAADRERANRELEIAREVQERLFPQRFPTVPGMDCAGYCRPARGVGGDYYDFLELEDGKIGIAIGDVSGKGIAAALLMASLQASLRGQAVAGLHDLAALMHNVNKLVYEASTSSRYATFFYGEFDPRTTRFTFVNAGHNAPIILRGSEVLRLQADGPVVGLLPGALYGQSECMLLPGDVFIAYTDGISEAMNEREEEWEEDQFIAAAQRCRGMTAKRMIDSIFMEADRFTGSAKQYDDMTLLVVKLS